MKVHLNVGTHTSPMARCRQLRPRPTWALTGDLDEVTCARCRALAGAEAVSPLATVRAAEALLREAADTLALAARQLEVARG